jgi:hypothetical protein
MRRILRRRPSPALVIACLALGVALGGTSYAAVTQLPRASVGTPQLKSSAVTNAKLARNAVTSVKVRNGTLVRADFARGALLRGPAGPTGAAGPAGPAGPPGLSGVERVEVTTAANSTALKSAQMPCPTGKRLLGGGARLNNAPPAVALQQSFPDNDNVYRASAREVASTATTWSLTVFAVCAVVS